jgi:hypothetical protein
MAESTPDTTTATCTDGMLPAGDALADDLWALVDERAAILEFDGGHDRDTADRLAREMVLGPDVQQLPADDIVAAADLLGLAVRSNPYVRQTLGHFTGAVRLIDDKSDPFAMRRRKPTRRRPGQCSCGHDDRWVQVSIHGGHSVRVDCGHCDRFGWFAVWHGKRQSAPDDDAVQLLPSFPAVPVDALVLS